MIKIYVDASFHQPTQKSGIGLLFVENKRQTPLVEVGPKAIDNHQAELYATMRAMELAIQMNKQKQLIFLFSDSQLVVDTLRKRYVKQAKYQEIVQQIFQLLDQFENLFIEWIPEQQNRGADQLARQGLTLAMKNERNGE